MNEPAIQNLDFLRKLIADTRREAPAMDMAKLRMRQGSGMGTDAITTKKGDE
jgi:hypothetical protein